MSVVVVKTNCEIVDSTVERVCLTSSDVCGVMLVNADVNSVVFFIIVVSAVVVVSSTVVALKDERGIIVVGEA